MTTVFPSGLDNFNNPSSTDNLNTPTVLHSDQHANANDAIEAIEAWVGISGSNNPASQEYRIAQLENTPPGGTAFGVIGQDEGVFVGTGTILNVVGDNVSLTRSGTVLQLTHTNPTISFPQPILGLMGQNKGVHLGTGTTLNATGDLGMSLSGTVLDIHYSTPSVSFPQDNIGIFGINAGIPLGTGTVLNVTGNGGILSLSGTVLNLNITDTQGGGGSSLVGIMGQDEGIPIGTGTTLNVTGDNIQLSLSGTVLNINHTNPSVIFPQDNIGIFGKDEGQPVGTGTVLNVVGSNISLTLSGTTLTLEHTNPTISFPQPVMGLMGWDEGVPLGTGTILNVVGSRLSLSFSGTVLQLISSPDPIDNIGIFARSNGTNLGTGTIIDFGLGINAAITGTTIFVHPFAGGTNGDAWVRVTGSSQGAAWVDQDYNIQFHLGDGANVVSTGSITAGYGYVEVPVDSIVESWTVLGDATGSIVTNIYKSTYAGFPPTSLLAGLGQPLMTNLRKNTGNATGTANMSKGDVLLLEVKSVTTLKLATVSLQCRKNATL